MNALVTGGGGFLGRYIVERLLARGDRVRVLGRSAAPELESLGAEMIRGDLRDRQQVVDACRQIDTVFHVAAVAGIWGPWELFYATNVLGTRHVLDGCRQHQVRRLVYTSSPSVTFDGTPQQGIDESAPYATRPMAHYPRSKAEAERAVLEANRTDGLSTCALRPHLIWGPRDNHLIPRLLARARSGRLRRVGDGTNRVDMIYVENAAEAHLQAADCLTGPTGPIAGKAYFLSQGDPVRCWDWIDDILALAGLPPVTRSVSAAAASRIGGGCELLWRTLRLPGEPPMTRFLAAQLGSSHWFNIDAARRDFGYQVRVSTVEGMQRLGQWLGESGERRAESRESRVES
jgi:2-alkyl-3-oxoalkanoate reductase